MASFSAASPRALCAIAIFAALAVPAAAQKDGFPQRTVTFIVPFAPGASTDILARAIAQKLAESWGQPVVADNRPGASGMIGLGAVARSSPDGHTLGMLIVSHATHVALQGVKAPLDLTKDLAPVVLVAAQPYLLLVNASLPARSMRELIALARARPGALTYGSSGVGSVLHLAGELLAAQARVQLTHVPYKGAALALSDVAGGHLAMVFTTRPTAQSLLAAGRVRALAVTSNERVSVMPDVPTMREAAALKSFEVNGWYGVAAAAGTPASVVQRLNQEINRVLKLPDIRERMLAEGTIPAGGTPAEFGELVRAEIAKWRGIIAHAGIAPGG